MSEKIYLSANDYLHDVWRLAAKIKASGWKPDLLIALWRGGAPVGIGVHEFFKVAGWKINHLPLKCTSYTGIEKNEGDIVFTGLDPILAEIKTVRRVLVVDDVFDTGRTVAAMHRLLDGFPIEVRYACVYWKPSKNVTPYKPDYYEADKDHTWIVFPHECEGLTPEEIKTKDGLLASLLKDGTGA